MKRKAENPIFKAVTKKRLIKDIAKKLVKTTVSRTSGSKYNQAVSRVPEQKFMDATLNVNTSNAGGSQLLTICQTGTDNNANRIGRKITNKSVQYDLMWCASSGDLGTAAAWPEGAGVCKWALVYDKQPNGALATWDDVFNSTTNIATPFCFKNYNNIDRFDILAIEEFEICVTGPNIQRKSRFVPMNLETRFDGTSNAITDVQSGCLLMVYGDSNSTGAAAASLTGRIRVLYTDD